MHYSLILFRLKVKGLRVCTEITLLILEVFTIKVIVVNNLFEILGIFRVLYQAFGYAVSMS